MPQPKRDAAHRYFEYEEASDKSTCLLCKIKLKGKHATNLKNHLAEKHLEEYKVIADLNKNTTPTPTNNTDALSPAPTINKIKKLCVRLVTVHGRPLAMMEDEAFQDLVSMAATTKDASKSTNVKAVKKSIQEEATNIRNKISVEVKNKLISLKIDAATCQERKFIGINIQYIKDAKITIRNLAVLEIFQRQTAEFLRSAVEETLAEFKISVEQIHCICTDNGSNMVKMVKNLGGEYCSTNETAENDDDVDDQDEDDSTNNTLDDFFIDLDINNLIINNSFKIRGMLCAAHTLQLAVNNAIEENVMAQNTITTARKIANILRAPNNANVLKTSNLRKAIKDCPTRWSSTFNMLERLLSLREFCNTIPNITLLMIDSFWDDVLELIQCLKPATLATQLLQKEQFTIGDFFITWFNCKNEVKIIESHFAITFHQAMERREVKLMENDVILEGLYLDGRLNVILSTEQCQKARNLLSDVCRQMRRLEALTVESEADAESVELIADISGQSGPSTSRASSALEQMLLTTERVRGPRQLRSFEICLYELLTTPRLPLTEEILVHWQNKSFISSELSMVANIVLGAPVTQVSVERLFSSLKFILSPLRSNLGSVFLKDLMMIRENKDLLQG